MNNPHRPVLQTGNSTKIRLTRKRKAIIIALARLDRTFRVDDLQKLLEQEGWRITKRTVTRTLSLLVSNGLLFRFRGDTKAWIYEKIYNTTNGNRLVCIVCGHILEFGTEQLKFETETICKKFNFRVESISSNIIGVCLNCRYFHSRYN